MSTITGELDDETKAVGGCSPAVLDAKMHVDEMKAVSDFYNPTVIQKTVSQIPYVTNPTLSETDKSLDERMSLVKVESDLMAYVDQLKAAEAQMAGTDAAESTPEEPNFPFLAWEALKVGLAKEKATNDQIARHIAEIEKGQREISLLLQVTTELNGIKDEGGEMSQKLKGLLIELKESGIELWKGEGGSLSKEEISKLKSATSSQVEQLRSNIQIIFSTKVQMLIQNIATILEVVRGMIQQNSRLINATLKPPGH